MVTLEIETALAPESAHIGYGSALGPHQPRGSYGIATVSSGNAATLASAPSATSLLRASLHVDEFKASLDPLEPRIDAIDPFMYACLAFSHRGNTVL